MKVEMLKVKGKILSLSSYKSKGKSKVYAYRVDFLGRIYLIWTSTYDYWMRREEIYSRINV